MKLYQVDFRDGALREATATEFSFVPKLRLEFIEGQKAAGIEVEAPVRLPKGTSLEDARAMALENARKLLRLAAALPEQEIRDLMFDFERDQG